MAGNDQPHPVTHHPARVDRSYEPADSIGLTAAWLATGILLVIAEAPVGLGEPRGPRRTEGASSRRFDELVIGEAGGVDASLLSIRVGSGRGPTTAQSLEFGRSAPFTRKQIDLVHGLVTLPTLAREHLEALDPERRAGVLHFIAAAAGEHGVAETIGLSDSLHLVRESLREHLATDEDAATRPNRLDIDPVFVVDDRSFWISGSYRGPPLCRLTAVSPEGWRTEVLSDLVWEPHPSAQPRHQSRAQRFSCHFSSSIPSMLASGWVVEAQSELEDSYEVTVPAVSDDLPAMVEALLGGEIGQASTELPSDERGRRTDFLSEATSVMARDVDMHSRAWGTPPACPDTSVIVVLGERFDSMEHQLVHFRDDPDFATAELIYAMEGAERALELVALAGRLHDLHDVPIRVVISDHVGGRAMVTNLTAEWATGRLLVLLHPDVVPERPGWLSAMAAFHDGQPNVGTVAPTLAFEQTSLDDRACSSGSAATATILPAARERCLMVARATYRDVGGLRLVMPDHEPAELELCERLRRSGRENCDLPDVTLTLLGEPSADREHGVRSVVAEPSR